MKMWRGLRLLRSPQFLPNVVACKLLEKDMKNEKHTAKFNTENALKLAQDLRARDGPSRFVVLDHRRLLIDL